jgi:hypothetical protein
MNISIIQLPIIAAHVVLNGLNHGAVLLLGRGDLPGSKATGTTQLHATQLANRTHMKGE